MLPAGTKKQKTNDKLTPGSSLCKISESCDPLKGVSTMLQDKFAFMHHGRGHQDTRCRRHLPSTSQGRQTNGKRQQECRPSSNMTERNPVRGWQESQQEWQERRNSSFMAMYFWEQNVRYGSLIAWAKSNGPSVPTGPSAFQSLSDCSSLEGALSFTPGSSNYTLYSTKLKTTRPNADNLLFLQVHGFVMDHCKRNTGNGTRKAPFTESVGHEWDDLDTHRTNKTVKSLETEWNRS